MAKAIIDVRSRVVVMAGVVAAVVAATAGAAVPVFQESQPPTVAAPEDAVEPGAEAQAEAQAEALRAVVLSSAGRAQWRGEEEAQWKDAAVDDVLEPGARIRTGRNSTMVLRVGQNATVMVDRNTRMALPEILRDGQTLRTAVQLTRGRADFKVDRVGLTNDFSVVTPSTTLAVQGTDWGIEYGGFEGTRVFGARANEIAAIELRYLLTRHSYFLSGGATSSDGHRNPVIAEMFKSLGPPRVQSFATEGVMAPGLLVDAFGRNPAGDMRRVDLSVTGLANTLSNPIFIPPEQVIEDKGVEEEPVGGPSEQQLVEP